MRYGEGCKAGRRGRTEARAAAGAVLQAEIKLMGCR